MLRTWTGSVVGCSLVAWACLTQGQSAPAVDPNAGANELFRLYSEGRHEAVVLALSRRVFSPPALEAWVRSVQREISHWPRETGAAFALEAASATYLVRNTLDFSDVIEEGSLRLRSGHAPDAFEKQWHLAAAALVNGPATARLGGRAEGGSGVSSDHLDEYFDEVKRRFPRDPDLALARGEFLEAHFHRWLDTWGVGSQRPGASLPNMAPFKAVATLKETAAAFSIAQSDPATKAEADLRLGSVLAYQGDREGALRLWAALVGNTHDDTLRYLAYVFRGRVLSDMGRLAEAGEAYRLALAIHPGAPSAEVPQAALLFLDGHRSEAGQLVEGALGRSLAARDPFWSYLAPGNRDWLSRRNALREALAVKR